MLVVLVVPVVPVGRLVPVVPVGLLVSGVG
jgi:hypothetical protein